MQLTGIIAEYNPFHNGHQYHLAQTKKMQPSDGIVTVMSGNFTQRGEAALFDKWTRAEMALRCGVDLVLELPVAFAVRSAAYFAQGAVWTLAATGAVNALSCGVESAAPAQLEPLAAFLADEPPAFRQLLQQHLSTGLSFPAARQKALEQLQIAGAQQLQSPNNILALHYLQAIQQSQLPIKPVFISRLGSYHDDTVPPDQYSFASASAVRRLLCAEDAQWQAHVPQPVRLLIQERLQQGCPPMEMQAFEQILFAQLRCSSPEQLATLLEMREGLENRLYSAARQVNTWEALCAAVKSKRYTRTRIQRALVYLLLQITQQQQWQAPQYLRVLGFTAQGQKILKEMKKTAHLPILTRPTRQQRLLSAEGRQMLALDCRATDLYYMGHRQPQLRKCNLDLLRQPVQV